MYVCAYRIFGDCAGLASGSSIRAVSAGLPSGSSHWPLSAGLRSGSSYLPVSAACRFEWPRFSKPSEKPFHGFRHFQKHFHNLFGDLLQA